MTNAKHAGAWHTSARSTTRGNTSAGRQSNARPGGSVITALAVLLCAACGAGQAPPAGSGAGTGAGAAGSGSVALSIGAVASPVSISGTMPAAGRYFLTVDTTLHDLSTPSPIPAGYANYALVTTKGLSLAPSGASELVPTPCAPDTSVVSGAQYSCTAVFEVPTGDAPQQLSYDDQHGDTATAPVSYMPPQGPSTGCATFVSFARTGTDACTQCKEYGACAPEWEMLLTATSDGQLCPDAGTKCQSCPMSDSSPGYCACWEGCLGGCESLFNAYYECLVIHCAVECG